MAADLSQAAELLKKWGYKVDTDLLRIATEPRRRGHVIHTPIAGEELAKRTAWLERWQQLTDEGLEKGYLDHAHCYECGGELEQVTSVDTVSWVWDETEEEYMARLGFEKEEGGTVTFPVRKR